MTVHVPRSKLKGSLGPGHRAHSSSHSGLPVERTGVGEWTLPTVKPYGSHQSADIAEGVHTPLEKPRKSEFYYVCRLC